MTFYCVAAIYWFIAVCLSAWIGWYALTIFQVKSPNTPHLWQQRLLNFVGSLIGWVVLWALGIRFWDSLVTPNGYSTATVGWWDVLGGFVAFIGVTGYLPYTVIGLIHAVFEQGRTLALIVGRFLKP